MKVGDTVVLNDIGLKALFSLRFVKFLQPMKKVQMKITDIHRNGVIEVDENSINVKTLYTNYFDVVKQS